VRFNGYAFAAADALAPIVGVELLRAALSMPCAFLQHSGRCMQCMRDAQALPMGQ
jgi:hypothetical protein